MPHDPESAAEPVPLSLSAPRSARIDLVRDLVRPPSANPEAPVLDLAQPDERIVEFLVGVAHSDTGFIAATGSGPRAVAIVAATAAALCGEDIPAALAGPDIAFLRGLTAPAVEALREVLLAIETDRPSAVTEELRILAP